MSKRGLRSVLVTAAATLLVAGCGGGGGGESGTGAGDFNAEQFFQGKTIRLVITQSVGGGTDIASRFIAQNLPNFLPGKPAINVTNLQDTAGLNRVYSSPPDDLIIGATSNAQSLYTTAKEEGAEHDPQDLRVLGALAPSPRVMLLAGSLGYGSFADAVGASDKKTLRFPGSIGGPDEVQDDQILTPWLCDNLKLNCEMIQVADDDSAALNLMLERGEINADTAGLVSRLRTLGDGLETKKYVLGATYDAGDGKAEVKLPEGISMPPDLSEIVPENLREDYEAMLPISGSGGLGTVLWTGPKMSEDVVDAIRVGLDDMLADQKVLADFEELQQADVQWIPGGDAETILREQAGVYEKNLDRYAELQQKYWDQYWKP
jgi:hypothetical protein